jgi:hypothetical protein
LAGKYHHSSAYPDKPPHSSYFSSQNSDFLARNEIVDRYLEIERAHYEKRSEWFERIGLAAVVGLVFAPLTSCSTEQKFVMGGLLATVLAYSVANYLLIKAKHVTQKSTRLQEENINESDTTAKGGGLMS